jgi:hypothetical protein
MQLIVKMLIAFFVVLTISGCSSKLIMVPIACEIPKVDEPMIDTVSKESALGESKRCARNYFIMRESYEKLKKVVEVCQ